MYVKYVCRVYLRFDCLDFFDFLEVLRLLDLDFFCVFLEERFFPPVCLLSIIFPDSVKPLLVNVSFSSPIVSVKFVLSFVSNVITPSFFITLVTLINESVIVYL